MDVLHCHWMLCRRKSAVFKCTFVHFGLTGSLEKSVMILWSEGGKSWKTFVGGVTAKKLLSHCGSHHGLCETIATRAGNVEKESVCGCSEWFYPGGCSSPWSQPCSPDDQTRLGILRDNFSCSFLPPPSVRKYCLHVCVFPGVAYFQFVSCNLC